MSQDTQQKSWFERLGQSLSREPKDRDELMEVLRDAEQRQVIDSDDLEMLEGVLEVSETQVRDIMIPRSQMTLLDANAPLHEIIPIIVKSGHSRFPVMEESKDEILGIVFAKDLLQFAFDANSHASFQLSQIAHKPMFTPESKRVDILLKDFQVARNHMAIVVDEYGKVSGLLTIEDVLEEIVGEIEDEHDDAEVAQIREQGPNKFIIDALTPVEDFNEHFNTEFSDEEFDTIGGLVIHEFGHLPKVGELVALGDFTFTVKQADKRKVTLLEATLLADLS